MRGHVKKIRVPFYDDRGGHEAVISHWQWVSWYDDGGPATDETAGTAQQQNINRDRRRICLNHVWC